MYVYARARKTDKLGNASASVRNFVSTGDSCRLTATRRQQNTKGTSMKIEMNKRNREAMARYEAAVLAARSRALENGCTGEELTQAVLADPEVEAVGNEPEVRRAILAQESIRLLNSEPDLLLAYQNDYPGAKDRLLGKIGTRIRRARLAGSWQEAFK
jgi:hypothetical protein